MNFLSTLLAQGLENKALTSEFRDFSGFDFLNNLLPNIIGIAFIIAAIVFVLMLLIGGIEWTRAGSDKALLESARSRITNAIVGLVVLVVIYALVQLVNALFGLNIGGIGIGEPPPTVAGICEGPSNNCSCTCPEGYYVLTQCSNLPQCSDSSCTCANDAYPPPNPNIIVQIKDPIDAEIISHRGQSDYEALAYVVGANPPGYGLEFVRLTLLNSNGNIIKEYEDTSGGGPNGLYCLNGLQSPCPLLPDAIWDSLNNGPHSLTAQAKAIDGTWSAPVQVTFFIQKSVPVGNCSISGPSSVPGGTSGTYTATWDFPGANLDAAYISVTRTDLSGNWQTVYNESNPESSFWTASVDISFPFVGFNYYVTCGASDTTGKSCTGNPWCEWEPNPPQTIVCAPNNYNCGLSDLLTVLSAPPNTPTPTITPTPFITPGPTALLNSSSGMNCGTFCNSQPPFNSCLSVGTDGVNNQAIMYNPNTGQCYVQTNAGCGQNMINWNHQCPNPATGESHAAGWTYCTCQ